MNFLLGPISGLRDMVLLVVFYWRSMVDNVHTNLIRVDFIEGIFLDWLLLILERAIRIKFEFIVVGDVVEKRTYSSLVILLWVAFFLNSFSFFFYTLMSYLIKENIVKC